MQHTNVCPIKGLTTSAPSTVSLSSVEYPISVVETYHSGNSWYRKYSDGWIEQGGYYETDSTWSNYNTFSVTFVTEFTAAPLMVHCIETATGSSTGIQGLYGVQDVTKSGFTFVNTRTGSKQTGFYWTAKGI